MGDHRGRLRGDGLLGGLSRLSEGIFASICGRGGRFILVAFLLYRFGSPIRTFIEKYFNLVTIAFMVLIVGGFVLIKYLVH